ncbi:MAG: sodium:solute symporter, partial [Oscillospiraceae bacterium]|nr:sodium:solute symporter [Oscillospiraceae bacterium]
PQMVQKFYAIKSEKSVYTGTIISTFFAAVVAGGCYFLGGFGRLFSTPEIVAQNGYDSIVPEMLSNLGDVMIGLVIVLVLSASMSTLSSLVLTSSSSLTLDFIAPMSKKGMTEKKKLLIMRIFLAVFIIISVILAIVQYKTQATFIAQMMGLSWGALAGAFLAPLLYGLYWKRTTKAACWVCFITGPVIMVLNTFVPALFPTFLKSPINCGAFTMILGLIIVPVISLLTKKPDEKMVDDIFSCYEEKVLVNASESLGNAE